MTCSFAPPWRGPYSAAAAAAHAMYGSACARPGHAHGGRAAVLLVVGVEDEQHVERLGDDRILVRILLVRAEHHVQEVRGEAEVVVGIHERHADGEPVATRGQRRHLGDQPGDLLVARALAVDLLGLRVEGRHRGDGRDEHPHRMGVVVEALHEPLAHVLVDVGVVRDVVGPRRELRLRWQLAVEQQVRDFEERRLLGQLFDRVAAVAQDAGVAVELGDRTLARRGPHETGVVEEDVRQSLAPVTRAHTTVDDRKFELFASAVVSDRDRLSHVPHLIGSHASDSRGEPRQIRRQMVVQAGHEKQTEDQ